MLTQPSLPGAKTAPFQGGIGLLLATLVFGSYLSNFVFLVFFLDVTTQWSWEIALGALQVWLSVGLFIVAHDCMHGSLVPGRPKLNDAIGRLCLFFYAGFPYDKLKAAHHLHHRHAGTEHDPDFDAQHPTRFPRWFFTFVRRYFGWREFGILTVFLLSQVALGAPIEKVLLFWALPAQLSALQLFFFGTFLPHRHSHQPFADEHRSRTLAVPSLVSLATCFHFGFHHEHHLFPYVPWWRLPHAHRTIRSAPAGGASDPLALATSMHVDSRQGSASA